MRPSGIVCSIAVVLAMLAVPAVSNAGSKTGKSAKGLNCKTAGTFLNGANADILIGTGEGTFVASTVGRCNRGFGQVGTMSMVAPLAAQPTLPSNCVALASAPNGGGSGLSPSITYNKKGDSILYEIRPAYPALQCFFAADGITPVAPAAFCGAPGSTAYFSTSTVPFTIVSGTGKYAGATGGGSFTSHASHCDPSKPLANFVESTLKNGTLVVP